MTIEIHDNLLEPHVAELIEDFMKNQLRWHYYYHSHKNKHFFLPSCDKNYFYSVFVILVYFKIGGQ